MGILDSFVTIVDDDDKKGQDKQDGQEPKKKKLMYRSPARDFSGRSYTVLIVAVLTYMSMRTPLLLTEHEAVFGMPGIITSR